MAEDAKKTITLSIKRMDPRNDVAPTVQDYTIDVDAGASVLNALNQIFEQVDPSLAYYGSCRLGKCKGCDVLIDGKVEMTCTTPANRDMTLAPLPDFVLIRDLVVDKDKPKRAARQSLFKGKVR